MLARKSCSFVSRLSPLRIRCCSSAVQTEMTPRQESAEAKPEKAGGFHQAFLKYTSMESGGIQDDVPFAKLMRHSKFIDLGDPAGKIVNGTIFHVVNNDLYIDFGGKFHCVCPRPSKNGQLFVRGAIVKLKLKELELSTKFLGSDKDMSLLEADAELLGLVSTPRTSR